MNLKVDTWVVNASPIISLSRIGGIDLLIKVCPMIIIPYGVYEEILEYPVGDEAKKWIKSSGKEYLKNVSVKPVIALWDLGKGESQVISLAYNNKNYGVIIDDKPARNCAKTYNIKLHGTIGVLIQAKRKNLIDDLESLLRKLQTSGFRISDDIIDMAIELSGR